MKERRKPEAPRLLRARQGPEGPRDRKGGTHSSTKWPLPPTTQEATQHASAGRSFPAGTIEMESLERRTPSSFRAPFYTAGVSGEACGTEAAAQGLPLRPDPGRLQEGGGGGDISAIG